MRKKRNDGMMFVYATEQMIREERNEERRLKGKKMTTQNGTKEEEKRKKRTGRAGKQRPELEKLQPFRWEQGN